MSITIATILFAENILEEDEYICYIKLIRSQEGLIARRAFDLNNISELHCLKNFRFARPELEELCEQLKFPATFVSSNRCRMSGIEGLCLLLRRLAYPSRLHDLEIIFGKELSVLSRMFNLTLNHVYEKFGHLLRDVDQPWITRNELVKLARAITRKGSPYDRLVAFLDGTNMEICRPSDYAIQKVCYSGYTREHDLKYSGGMSPCGIMFHLHGPEPGSFHDSKMLRLSGLETRLAESQIWSPPGERPSHFYGDQAYKATAQIAAPFRGTVTDDQNECNKRLTSFRICVEWGFGKISQLFAFTEFAENQKILLQPVAKYYLVAGILTNCHTCKYGSLTSDYFQVDPPHLSDYLRNL